MRTNQKFAVSAIFLGFLLLANACPTRAQAIPTLRSDNVLENASSSSTISTANVAAEDLATALGAEPAAATPAGGGAAAAASTAPEGNWHFAVSPYLWVPWVYGSVGANGNNIHFYATPDELFSHFRFGLLGLVDTRYKRVVLPLDIIWLRLGDDRALPLTPNGTVANVKLDMFILTPKVGYRVIDTKMIKIDALAGFRYWHVGQNLQFTTNTLNFSGSQNWVDPLVGGRILGNLSPKVEIAIGGDVGGWGTGSQLDYSVGAFLGYRIKPPVALQAGYRYMAVDYTNGNKLLNLIISGPLIGVTINLK